MRRCPSKAQSERQHAAVLVSVHVRSCGSTLSSHIKHVDERRLQTETEWQHTDDHILCQSDHVTTFRANFCLVIQQGARKDAPTPRTKNMFSNQ